MHAVLLLDRELSECNVFLQSTWLLYPQMNAMIGCVNDSFRSHSLQIFYQVRLLVQTCLGVAGYADP